MRFENSNGFAHAANTSTLLQETVELNEGELAGAHAGLPAGAPEGDAVGELVGAQAGEPAGAHVGAAVELVVEAEVPSALPPLVHLLGSTGTIKIGSSAMIFIAARFSSISLSIAS